MAKFKNTEAEEVMEENITLEEKEEKLEEMEVSNKGRQENEYFFPHKRVTIKAFSLQEAIKKLNEND